MMLNELEIITWCYAIYLLLDHRLISQELGEESILKFASSEELVLTCGIFAKFACNDINDQHTLCIIEKLNLNKDLIVSMFS